MCYLPHAWWNFPPLSIGQIHFKFKGGSVEIYNFIQILKVHSVASALVLHCLLMSHKMALGLNELIFRWFILTVFDPISLHVCIYKQRECEKV